MHISDLPTTLSQIGGVAPGGQPDSRRRAIPNAPARRNLSVPLPVERPGGAMQVKGARAGSAPAANPGEQWQRDFLAALDPLDYLRPLLDHAEGICFFVKDAAGRIVFANEDLKRRFRACGHELIEGRTDHELLPKCHADQFRRDDRWVMRTARPLCDRVELLFDHTGVRRWVCTTKVPLRDRDGKVVGVAGLARACPTGLMPPAARDLSAAIAILERDTANPPTIPQLARATGLSVRHLQRRFKQVFGFGPRDFSLRCRLAGAQELLSDPRLSLSQIAIRAGFHDQSAFTVAFRQCFGLTPGAHRRKLRPPA